MNADSFRKRLDASIREYARSADQAAARLKASLVCGALTCKGTPCQMRAVPGKGRCRLHGGCSTGPKTAEGRARISESNRRLAAALRCSSPAKCRHSNCSGGIRSVTSTYLEKLKDGSKTAREVVDLARRAAEAAPRPALLDATQALATLEEIGKAATTVKGDIAAEHFLLVVDSLHSWADALGGGDEYEHLNDGLAALRMQAKRLNCPVLTIAERNRGAMKSSGQSSGAGTRKIEYGAETVIALDTDEDAKESLDGLKEVKLTIGKNRNGATGKTTLLFHGGMMKFTESPI